MFAPISCVETDAANVAGVAKTRVFSVLEGLIISYVFNVLKVAAFLRFSNSLAHSLPSLPLLLKLVTRVYALRR